MRSYISNAELEELGEGIIFGCTGGDPSKLERIDIDGLITDYLGLLIEYERFAEEDNAELFEEAFYGKKGIEDAEGAKQEASTEEEPTGGAADSGIDAKTLAKLVSSPELASLLKILAKNF